MTNKLTMLFFSKKLLYSTLILFALIFWNTQLASANSSPECGQKRLTVSMDGTTSYGCYRTGLPTLYEGEFQECVNTPPDKNCCPLTVSCETIPTISCGEDTFYAKGTKQCSCTEDSLPDGRVCCGYYDPTSPGDICKTSPPTTASCGDTRTVLFGTEPSPSSCHCAGWYKTSSSISSGDTFCCGMQDPANPTVCTAQKIFECGEVISLTASAHPASQFTCSCAGASWSMTTEPAQSTSWCCGWYTSRTQNHCSSQKIVNDRCNQVSGCNFCDKPTDFCTVSGGLSTCSEIPGQCGAPITPPAGGGGTGAGGTGGGGTTDTDPEPEAAGPELDIFAGPSNADFAALNPFNIYNSPYADNFSSPAGIINRALLFAFPLAGLLLFVMIVWGGFEMVSGATNSKSLQAGRQRITAALIGFGLLFVSFWIIQIVEYIFNIAVL